MKLKRGSGLISRRAALLAPALPCLALGEQAPDDKSFRQRVQTIDALLQRFKTARAQSKITLPDYRLSIQLLREEEILISEQAKIHPFKDLTEANFWHRSRLKFPSALQTELRMAEDGQDPANRPH